jgi:hypothetical protein
MISNHTIAKGLLAFVLTLGSTAVMAQQDPFTGTWVEKLAKSKYDPASLTPKHGTTIKIVATGNGRKVTTDGVTALGTPIHTEYNASTLDEKDYPLSGSPNYDSVATKRIDADTTITVNKKGGIVVRMLRGTVSKDGKTLTLDQVGYNAQGQAFHEVTVYGKQ